jgi:hypothetical protein
MPAKATPRVYCTYFDSGYLSRGLALISSLRSHGDNSEVYVLALDNETEKFLTNHAPENVFVINIGELERAEPSLLPLKVQRSRMEYYFTCTPLLIRYVMNQLATPGSVAIYLDADLYFYNDPQLVISAMGKDSVGIIEHRYPDAVAKKLAKYGRFNVGWVGFRDDNPGRNVLDWYASKTLEWCSDKPENGKYADQGYLDWFPEFEGVAILESAGFNLAPWNTKRHKLRLTQQLEVDGEPFVFFHFHGLRAVGHWFVSSQIIYKSQMSQLLRDEIYQPYVNHMSAIDDAIAQYLPARTIKKRGNGMSGALSRFRKNLVNFVSIATGNAIKAKD